MKVKKLIKELKRLKKEHGNLLVTFDSDIGFTPKTPFLVQAYDEYGNIEGKPKTIHIH